MARLKMLVENERGVSPLRGGHALCQGCGIPLVVRQLIQGKSPSRLDRPPLTQLA